MDPANRDRLPWPSLAAFVAAAAVYSAPWVPLLILQAENSLPITAFLFELFDVDRQIRPQIENTLAVAAFLGFALPLAVYFAGYFRQRFPRLTVGLAIPYWAIVVACHELHLLVTYCMAPAYFAACLALAAGALISRRAGPGRLLVTSATLLLAAGASFAELRQHSHLAATLTLGVGAACLGGTWWFFRRGALSSVSRTALAFAVFFVPIYSRGLIVWQLTFPRSAGEVLGQPGIRALFTYDDPRLAGRLPAQIMFMTRRPGTEQIVLVPQRPFHELTILTPGASPVVRRVDLGPRGSDNALWDADDSSRLWVGGGNQFYEISTTAAKILRQTTLGESFQKLNFVHFDARRNRFAWSQDFGDSLFVVDRETMQLVQRIRALPKSHFDDVWVDPVRDLIWSDSRYCHIFGRRLSAYRAEDFQLAKSYTMPWDFGFNFGTIDPVGGRAYLGSTIRGRVQVVDLDNLAVVDDIPVEAGIRCLNFDAVRRWVLIGSYFRGRLFVYDVERRALLGPLFLGKRLRWVEVDAERGVWTTATAAGGFEIDPDKAYAALARAGAE